LFVNAQQSDSSIYTIEKSRNFTAFFSLQWEYPTPLKEMLPTKSKKVVIDWQKSLIELKENQARYKTLILPQKEVLASCALMLVLLDKEADSKFYQTKAAFLKLLQERLNILENQYLEQCLKYLEQQKSSPQIITLWQTYFHYTTDGNEALYAAEKLLLATQKPSDLSLNKQEDLIATIYYIIGGIYADRGNWTNKKKYYTLCYELRKKRGDDLSYSMNRLLKNTGAGLEQQKTLFKDLLNSIQEHSCRNDKNIFKELMDYLLKNRQYDLALEGFEQGTLKYSCLQDLEELSYGNHCPYLYLAVEALSNGSTFDDATQDSIAMHWFEKWLTVLDTLTTKNPGLTEDYLKLEQQAYLNYTDHTCTRIVDYLLYYGKYELAKTFFKTHQKPIYFTPNTNPNILYNFNSFYYKFIPHHAVILNDSLVLANLKDYLDLSYNVIKGEEKAKIEGLGHDTKRGRECIAWLGLKTADTTTYLQYLEYWMLRAKQLNYLSEEILAHRYYCAALRKDQQYVKALEFALKFKKLTYSKPNTSTQEYALRVRAYFLDNVLNNYEINTIERKKAILVVKKQSHRKDRKWRRIALKKLQKQAPY
jgi:hypothetical protein